MEYDFKIHSNIMTINILRIVLFVLKKSSILARPSPNTFVLALVSFTFLTEMRI
jgi:hypothetical protein